MFEHSSLTLKKIGMFQTKLYIGIAGMIGAGKSTLCKNLSKEMDLPAYYEDVIKNKYLEDFYKDQKKYAFSLQVFLLNKRFKQQQKIVWNGKGAVQDRTIYEDGVFCKMLYDDGKISQRDYETYTELFQNMENFMRKPNLIVYLDVTAKESYSQIKKRSRDCESTIPLSYLEKLKKGYDEFIVTISKTVPVIRVNYSDFKSGNEIVEVIKKKWTKMRSIFNVGFEKKDSI